MIQQRKLPKRSSGIPGPAVGCHCATLRACENQKQTKPVPPLLSEEQGTPCAKLGFNLGAPRRLSPRLRKFWSPVAGEGKDEFLPTQSAHFNNNQHFPSLASPRAEGKATTFTSRLPYSDTKIYMRKKKKNLPGRDLLKLLLCDNLTNLLHRGNLKVSITGLEVSAVNLENDIWFNGKQSF